MINQTRRYCTKLKSQINDNSNNVSDQEIAPIDPRGFNIDTLSVLD